MHNQWSRSWRIFVTINVSVLQAYAGNQLITHASENIFAYKIYKWREENTGLLVVYFLFKKNPKTTPHGAAES